LAFIVVLAFDVSIQFAGAAGTVNQYHVQRAAAEYLRDHFDSKSRWRIFCDDGTVKVLSGIPEERFVTSSGVPLDREGFLSALRRTTSSISFLWTISQQR
jgi:hypothetical protein